MPLPYALVLALMLHWRGSSTVYLLRHSVEPVEHILGHLHHGSSGFRVRGAHRTVAWAPASQEFKFRFRGALRRYDGQYGAQGMRVLSAFMLHEVALSIRHIGQCAVHCRA